MPFNPYAAGDKVYGSGRPMPTIGPVDKIGYRIRDMKARAKRNATLRRMKAIDKQKYFSSDYLGNGG